MLHNVNVMQHQDFITIPDFANRIGMSRSQIFRRVQKGLIEAQKIGHVYLIPIEELHKITGETSDRDRDLIIKGVKRTLRDYGSVIRDLGDE